MNSKKEYPTGATRSSNMAGVTEGSTREPRYDLISGIGLRRLAETYAEGAEIHGDRNWEQGLPINDCINRSLAHIFHYLGGDRSEDHLAHAAWGLFAAMHFEDKVKRGGDLGN